MRTKNLLATLFAAALLMCAVAARAEDAIKAVYHLSDERLATMVMNNINNHMAADPGVRIVVVAVATGVKAFTFGAQDSGGRPFSDWVDQLTARGVEFRICENSMKALNLAKGDLIGNIGTVPSGMAEIARLQAREGFVYLHP